MFKISFLLVFFMSALAACEEISAQTGVPQFDDYNVKKIYKGKNAKLVMTKEDRMFRTRLRLAAKQKPNFAGQFILETWGCGASCLSGAAIDAKTGKVYWLPHTTCCWAFEENLSPIDARLNSRLIIFSGLRNESEKDNEYDMHFYEFKNGRFVFIKTVGRKANP